MQGNFDDSTQSTIGADHQMKTIIVDDQEVQLSLWDTAGQEAYRSIAPMTVRNANVCIFVVDASETETFRDIAEWRAILDEYNGKAKMILAINKIDLNKDLENKIDDAKSDLNNNEQSFAETKDILDEIRNLLNDYPDHFYVSAKDGTGIDDLFISAAKLGLEDEPEMPDKPPVENKDQKQCC